MQEQMEEKDAFAKEVGELNFQIFGLTSFKRRDQQMEGIQKEIKGLESFISEQSVEREKQ